ncbi:hypothetical protein [Streptomyces sp. NK15101]|uniref:hypothetical protein n=1 Tax=Streptomyces sp. NK15101 TaxID=2873261 RepID=UPI001CECF45F|nr:hypothetical protein [Streptomyces sp. NK15101]
MHPSRDHLRSAIGEYLARRSLEQLPYLTVFPSTRRVLRRHATEHPAGDVGGRPAKAVTYTETGCSR